MPTEYQFPQSNELTEIAQDKMARLEAARPWSQFFPIRTADSSILSWEQEDNYIGLQQIRGLNGEPPKVLKTGVKRYTMTPGAYGEFEPIDEIELTERRQFGSFGTPVQLSDLVMRIQDKLLLRRLDRIELIVWNLLVSGTFSVAGPSGAVLATDAYTTQTYSASPSWATTTTATPLADFRAVQLLAAGHSVSFNAQSTAYMNRITFNNLMSNTNAADIGGRRTSGFASVNSPGDLQALLTRDDLPNIVVYDEGYLAEPSGTFTRFIANGKVVVIGQRAGGAPIGEYRMTRNVNNPNMAPGAYQRVIDNGDTEIPRLIEVHDGHNGGPVIWYPSAIVVMSV
jgi:hypothetical protein